MHFHPLRSELHDEVHTRPRPPVTAPHAITHISVLRSGRPASEMPATLLDWCEQAGIAPPRPGLSHFDAQSGELRLKWERHGEFDDYTVYDPSCDAEQPYVSGAGEQLARALATPETGQVIAALRLAVLPADASGFDTRRAESVLDAVNLVGAAVSDASAAMYSSFRLDDDGFGRVLLIDRAANPRQLGRAVQRIIEMEVYRMMAMLAFPEARELGSELNRVERELSELVARLDVAPASEEPAILQEVTRLSALTEQNSTVSAFRFGAARAYTRLVRQRGEELRQTRLPGLQMPTEFLERRFEPAMAYCEAVSNRLDRVSARIGRASDLLGTRVEIERERQNQDLLAAMNRRAALQLRLQETVEGLSVAAIAYYATGLVGYGFKALASAGLPVNAEFATGLAVVPIVLAVAWSLRRVRRRIAGKANAE